MIIPDDHLAELKALCREAAVMPEGGYAYVHLPILKIPHNNTIIVREALLCPQARDGYATRLFLSEPVPGKGNNWSTHVILDRTWHTWSWKDVQPDRLTVVLAQHLVALR